MAYKPPRHVYFGPKDPATGEPMDEPVYYHQHFPKAMFRLDDDGNVESRTFVTQEALDAAGDEWVDSPAKLGVTTHPSQEELEAKREAERAKVRAMKAKKAA